MRTSEIYVTVDAVVFRKQNKLVEVLLIQRKNPPFQEQWALPGGFVEPGEDLETAVQRELKEETGVVYTRFQQLYTFGKPNRDPRGRTITTAYVGWAAPNTKPQAADDAKNARWFFINQLPILAFDHKEIVEKARQKADLV